MASDCGSGGTGSIPVEGTPTGTLSLLMSDVPFLSNKTRKNGKSEKRYSPKKNKRFP